MNSVEDGSSAGKTPPSDELIPDRSTRLTRAVSNVTAWLGSFPAILLSISVVLIWFIGVFFVNDHFTNTNYQLIVNTGTTIVTFWMVFIIQNTQNRDGKAIQAKLDAQSHALELICDYLGISVERLDDLVGLEDAPEKAIDQEKHEVKAQAAQTKIKGNR